MSLFTYITSIKCIVCKTGPNDELIDSLWFRQVAEYVRFVNARIGGGGYTLQLFYYTWMR